MVLEQRGLTDEQVLGLVGGAAVGCQRALIASEDQFAHFLVSVLAANLKGDERVWAGGLEDHEVRGFPVDRSKCVDTPSRSDRLERHAPQE